MEYTMEKLSGLLNMVSEVIREERTQKKERQTSRYRRASEGIAAKGIPAAKVLRGASIHISL